MSSSGETDKRDELFTRANTTGRLVTNISREPRACLTFFSLLVTIHAKP